jgi:hypothetical protein
MVPMRRHRKAKFPKEFHAPQKMKIIRVDHRTQIEVPENVPDDVAIERFNMRRGRGSKIAEMPPEVLKEAKKEGIANLEVTIPDEGADPVDDEE